MNHFYRYSLEDFNAVFSITLTTFYKTIKKEGIDLAKYMIREIILTFVSSISKHDRLFYFLHMINGVKTSTWDNERWKLFIALSQNDLDPTLAPTSFPEWLPEVLRRPLNIIQIHCPGLLPEHLDSKEWACWFQSDDCYSNFPGKICPEDRLLLVKMLRPDNLSTAISKYCCDVLGIETLTPRSETLAQHWNKNLKSNPFPVLLITTDGCDPGNEIRDLASTENCG